MTEEIDRLIFADTETFGLDPLHDFVLEVGFVITDLWLNVTHTFHQLIWEPSYYDSRLELLETQAPKNETATYVLKLHRENGLFEACKASGSTISEATNRMLVWLKEQGVTKEAPLCGSSIQFDRAMLEAQYPDVMALFSYRNIDTSSIKELCRRYAPGVYSALEKETAPKKMHRVMPDLEDTLSELSYYLAHFINPEQY